MSRTILACLFLLALPVAAAPQDDVRCDEAGTQSELNQCAFADYEAADAALNAAWRDLVAALADDPLALSRAREAQRAWIAFRDAEVEARLPVADGESAQFVHGSMYPLLRFGILTELTRDRTAQLRSYLEDRAWR